MSLFPLSFTLILRRKVVIMLCLCGLFNFLLEIRFARSDIDGCNGSVEKRVDRVRRKERKSKRKRKIDFFLRILLQLAFGPNENGRRNGIDDCNFCVCARQKSKRIRMLKKRDKQQLYGMLSSF